MLRKLKSLAATFLLCASATTAFASPHEARIPLHDGKLSLADLSATLLQECHLPTTRLPSGEINFNALRSSILISAMNRSLGDGCRLELRSDELLLHIDPDKLPKDVDTAKLAIRIFTATAAPEATAAQARHYGLLLPVKVDATRPLIVLIHGMDADNNQWTSIADLLKSAGYQVGYFSYPNDQPIADDETFLSQQVSALRDLFPKLQLNIITFSMGSLVARDYVEGPDYHGGIDRLIMLAPPNHGSTWAHFRVLAEWKEQFEMYMNDPQWSPTWMITDGLGEAGRDLLPGSKFPHANLRLLPAPPVHGPAIPASSPATNTPPAASPPTACTGNPPPSSPPAPPIGGASAKPEMNWKCIVEQNPRRHRPLRRPRNP